MITKIHQQWQKLYSCRKLNTDFKQKERKNFLEKLKETFWVPCPKYEASLQQSTDPRLQEDHQFLEKLRKGEKVVIGKLDVKLLKRNKRKASGEERLLNQSTEEDGDEHDRLSLSSSTDADTDDNDDEYTSSAIFKKKTITKNKLLTAKVGILADKHKVSDRALTEILGASAVDRGMDLDNCTVSVMSTNRKRKECRTILGQEIEANQQNIISDENHFVLQWDGKMLKSLQHTDKRREHIAIALKPLENSKTELLLSITQLAKNGTAENETEAIKEQLSKYHIDNNKIIGFCFDTTAVNTGIVNGIIMRLQQYLSQTVLLVACRHHIFELTSGDACRVVFGPTTSNEEPVFNLLKSNWERIKVNDYKSFNWDSLPRFLKRKREEVLQFCYSWINGPENKSLNIRKDYKELIMLTILYLGGNLNSKQAFHFQAPGASLHVRWMSRIMYTLKISSFKTQLLKLNLVSEARLDEISTLTLCLVLYHTQPWLTASNSLNSPMNDLKLYCELENDIKEMQKCSTIPQPFVEIASAYLKKLDHHLWYLSERLAVFALFSDLSSIFEKQKIAKELLKYEEDSKPAAKRPKITQQEMPILKQGTKIYNLMGRDS